MSGSLTHSVVTGNWINARSPHGTVTLAGAGIQVGDFDLTLHNTDVTSNTGIAIGNTGTAHGGGIADARIPAGHQADP